MERKGIHCTNHKDREAAYHCSYCKLAFCIDCVLIKEIQRTGIKLCPLCDNPLRIVEQAKPTPTFPEQLPSILSFPFRGYGLIVLLIWPVIGLVLRGIPALFAEGVEEFIKFSSPPFYLFYFMLMIPLFYHITNGAGNGKFDFPPITEKGFAIKTLGDSAMQLIGPFAGLFWPIALFAFAHMSTTVNYERTPSPIIYFFMKAFSVLIPINFVLGILILPMSLLVTSVLESVVDVFNPIYLVAQIRKIWKQYLLLLLGLVCTFSLYAGFRHLWLKFLFTRSPVSFVIYFIVDSSVHIYIAMVIAQVMGYMAFRYRYTLKWLAGTEKEPELLIIVEKPSVEHQEVTAPEPDEGIVEKLRHASYLIEHGNYDDAEKVFDEILKDHPANFDALGGRAMVAFRQEDHDTVKECGKKIGAEYVKRDALDALWEMYGDYRKSVPDFTFEPPVMNKLAQWLSGREAYLEAARVLRELAVRYPEDECAPESLFQCADLLLNKCDKLDTAANILKTILEKYPETEPAEKAGAILAELEKEER